MPYKISIANAVFLSVLGLCLILQARTSGALDISGLQGDENAVFTVPAVPRPGYLEAFTDPVFDTTVIRITDRGLAGGSIVPAYSKVQPWNADGSRMILYAPGTGHVLLDGRTFEFLGTVSLPFDELEEVWWHPADPDLIYGPLGDSLASYNVRTGEITVIRSFPEYESITTQSEGNLSIDFAWGAFVGRGGGGDEIFAYDIAGDVKHTAAAVGAGDWVSISALGRFVVVNGAGTDVYDTDINLLRHFDVAEHADLTADADGSDVYVTVNFDTAGGNGNAAIMKYDLAAGNPTILLQPDTYTFSGTHVTCRNTLPEARGWCFASTVGSPGDSFAGEIYVYGLDGSRAVGHISHHHSSGRDLSYWAEPHAAASRDGTRVIFGSDWGTGDENDIQTYIVYLPSAGPSCGDGECAGGETCSTCPADCGSCGGYCGNGSCDSGESCASCPADCLCPDEIEGVSESSPDTAVDAAADVAADAPRDATAQEEVEENGTEGCGCTVAIR